VQPNRGNGFRLWWRQGRGPHGGPAL